MMPSLLCDLAGNNTYVVELVILVLILIAIFALLFLNDQSDESDLPIEEDSSEEADETSSPEAEEEKEEPSEDKSEGPSDPIEASGLSKLSNTRSDKELGLVFESAPDVVDDLTKISGVGKVLQEKLNDFGIYRFEQIAAWDENIITEFSERLSFKGRVQREKWVEQAGKLAAESRD